MVTMVWPVAAATTAAVWVRLWVSTPMTTSTEAASMCIALAPCPDADVNGADPDKVRQDCDGHTPAVIGRSGSYSRPAAPTGPAPAAAGGQVQCQTPDRVSHSQGHTHRHQFQPWIITEPPGSLTDILLR